MTVTGYDHDLTAAVTAEVLGQVRASAAWDEAQARRVRERSAEAWEIAAAVKRQVADILAGAPVAADQVTEDGGLGMRVGPLPLTAPPADAPLEALERHRLVLERVYEIALRQMQRTRAEITRRRATLDTAQLAPEDIPGPDPLTATPAEDTGAHRVVVAERHVPVPPAAARWGQHRGRRVVVLMEGGTRAHGVLADVGDEVRLMPCEDGPDVIPVGRVLRVSPLPPRADAGIWCRDETGTLTNRLRDQDEAAEGGPGYPASPAVPPMTTQPDPVPAAPADGPARTTDPDAAAAEDQEAAVVRDPDTGAGS